MTGPIGVNEVVRVGIAIAAALQATHVAGHVNGRVSPAGILHGGAGPTLSDVDETTVDGFVPYASPEALRDQPQDARSDIYSLAATMWTMLAGYPPFAPDGEESADPAEYRERVLRRPAPLVPVTGVPGWLQTSLRRAMAKRPEDRYPSAAAFADAMRSHSGQPWAPIPAPVAQPQPGPEPLPIPRQRRAVPGEPGHEASAGAARSDAAAGLSTPDSYAPDRRRFKRFGVDAILIAAIIAVSVAIVLTVVAAGLLLR
jgi:serine/threonine protein kinase